MSEFYYFETKEEILLGLLVREYADWCGELERVAALAGGLSREELSAEMAHTLEECEEFCQTFSAFLLGCYPFTVHTEKQIEAMRLANVKMRDPGIYEMVYRCVYRLL